MRDRSVVRSVSSRRLSALLALAGSCVLTATAPSAHAQTGVFEFWQSRLGGQASTTINGMVVTRLSTGSLSVTRVSDGQRAVFSSTGIARYDLANGRTLFQYPDGKRSLVSSDGSRRVDWPSGARSTYYPGGREEHRLADGRYIVRTPGSWIEATEVRPDGTKIYSYANGTTVTFLPSGVRKTRLPDGRVVTGTWGNGGSTGGGGSGGGGGGAVTVPAAPSDLVVTEHGAGGLALAWADNSDNEQKFIIQRQPAFPGGSIEVAANMIALVDATAAPTAEYRIAAANTAGSSEFTGWGSLNQPATDFPVLVPGNGFSGPTAQPAAVGNASMAGYDAKAIARWDVVPYQTFDGDFHIGVVAFHMNGIDKVSFSVDGGPWTDVHEMKLNPQTDVWEYTATLRASDFADGPVEVRAIAWPAGAGEARVLGGEFQWTNSYGNSQWTGEHSLDLVANARRTQDELVLEIPSGTYAWGALPGAPTNAPSDRWLVIQPQPGATVTITPGLWHPQPHMIHLRNIKLVQPTRTATLRGSSDDILWLDSVEYTGPGMWERTDAIKALFTFWTDSTVRQSQFGHAQQFVRNCRFESIGEDTLKSAFLVVGTSVDNTGQPPAGLTWHPAVIANPIEHDNRIYYGLNSVARHGTWAFRNGTHNHWEHTDVAVIDCNSEKTTSGNQMWYLGGNVNHLLVRDSRFYEFGSLSFNFRLSNTLTNPEWQFRGHNVVFDNVNWQDDPNWMINPYPLEGVTVRQYP